jgi:hypothetical protein
MVAAGCGASARHQQGASGSGGSAGPGGSGTDAIPAPPATGVPVDPASVRVIRSWVDALSRGDVRAAARYFALPSQMIVGLDASGRPLVIRMHTSREAVAANATLPCGAEFISADKRGGYVNALFRLTDRPGPGGGCGPGTGQTARTNFVIVGGRIVDWIRAPDEPGDNSRKGAPGPAVPVPAPRPAIPVVSSDEFGEHRSA